MKCGADLQAFPFCWQQASLNWRETASLRFPGSRNHILRISFQERSRVLFQLCLKGEHCWTRPNVSSPRAIAFRRVQAVELANASPASQDLSKAFRRRRQLEHRPWLIIPETVLRAMGW